MGGAGYIGSHTARVLRKWGHDVAVYDNLSTGHASLTHGFELITGDIQNGNKLTAALRGAEAVLHFAAHAYVGESVSNPRKYFQNNVVGGLTLLNCVLDAGIEKLVFSSTCAVYGMPSTVPIREDFPRQPINPYGATKLAFECALEAYAGAYPMRFVSLRYFNAAGADESGEIGELHDPETHLIPSALQAVRGTRPSLEIYGDDYPTQDGTCIRDYIHVSDLAEAHVRALDYLQRGGTPTALNLGTGQGYSVKQVIQTVEKVAGKRVPLRYVPRRPGDPPVLVADPTRARNELGWQAKRSLDDVVATAWKWMRRGARQASEGGRSGI